MTGEITLRGLVLPVGGLKEKLLAAHRAGIPHVIIPKLNEKDLVDIPAEVKAKLHIILAETVDEVLAAAIEKVEIGKSRQRGKRRISKPGKLKN